MTDIGKHVAIRKLYEASLSLERLSASPEQTATAILIMDASQAVDALVNEVNRMQRVSIMVDFILLAAQQLRAACEPFRCDTFGCDTPESDALDKACAAVDRVVEVGLLETAKKTRDTEIAAAVARENERIARIVEKDYLDDDFPATNDDTENDAPSFVAQSVRRRIAAKIRSRPTPGAAKEESES